MKKDFAAIYKEKRNKSIKLSQEEWEILNQDKKSKTKTKRSWFKIWEKKQ